MKCFCFLMEMTLTAVNVPTDMKDKIVKKV